MREGFDFWPETDVAMGTSKANSAILHAGFDAKPGTWKGKLNVRGNHLYHQLWQDLAWMWTGWDLWLWPKNTGAVGK